MKLRSILLLKDSHPFLIIFAFLAAHLGSTLLKAIFISRPPTEVRAARECFHSYTPAAETDEKFFRRMWTSLHQVVEHCSNKHFRLRTKLFGTGQYSYKWLKWQIDLPEHSCNAVFVHNDNSTQLERALKRYTEKCVIYSVSEKHEELQRFQDARYSVLTVNQKINSKPKPSVYGRDHYIRDPESMDMVSFLTTQVHKLRFDSLNFYQDGSEHVKLLFTKSPFDEANLVTCQFNFIYDRPKTRLGRREFRSTWKRLLYDRRYLVTSVRRFNKGQSLSIFILNISDPYCWAKYISNSPFIAKHI